MIKINVYSVGGAWYGARWLDGEWDGCDELDLPEGATSADAIAHAAIMPLARPDEEPRDVTLVGVEHAEPDFDPRVDEWEAVSLSCAQDRPELGVPVLRWTTASESREWVVALEDEDGAVVYRRVPADEHADCD